MKFYCFITILLTCLILSSCKEKSKEIVIIGHLEEVEDGTIINLQKLENRTFIDLLSDTVVNGKFEFIFIDSVNQVIPLAIMGQGEGFPPTWLDLWVAPGSKTEISGKDKLLRTWDVKNNVPEQKELNIYKSRTNEYERISQLAMREAYAYWDSINAVPEKRAEFKAKIDSLYAINDSLYILKIEAEIDLLNENKTYSAIWLDKLNGNSMVLRYMELDQPYVEKMKELYENMSDELKTGETGQSIYLSLYPPTIVKDGDDMADTDMWDLEGNMRHLTDYKGKYILIDFWSSGCGPCIMAIPEMKEISETYKDQLFVVSISSDTKEIWEKVSKEKEISWVNLNDFKGENGLKLRYGVTGIPHYVMISPEGKIITSWTGYGKGLLKTKMEEFIKS